VSEDLSKLVSAPKTRVGVNEGRSVVVPGSLVRMLRSMLVDYPQTNELFEGEENSDEKLARYLVLAFDDWNSTPPILRYQLAPIDVVAVTAFYPFRPLVLTSALCAVLQSTMLKLARNDVPYQAGNVTMQRNAPWRNLIELQRQIKLENAQRVTAAKVSLNVAGFYGDGGYRAMLTEHYDGLEADAISVVI